MPEKLALKPVCHAGQHQEVLPTTIVGKVSKVGYYRDTLPLLIINMRKEDAAHLPYEIGQRVPVSLVINGARFVAGLRATAKASTIMICSDLADDDLNPVRLCDVLLSQGWTQRDTRIQLSFKNNTIYCLYP